MVNVIIKEVEYVVIILLSIALITLAERKILGVVQNRKGPDKIGKIGILQPIADGLKLVVKESVIPGISKKNYFIISPQYGIIISMLI